MRLTSVLTSIATACLALLVTTAVNAQNIGNPPMATDGLIIVEGANEMFGNRTNAGVKSAEKGKYIVLESKATTGYTMVSRQTKFPYNELIPSWNVWCPKGAGVRLLLSTAVTPGNNDWFEAARWGDYQFPYPVEFKQKVPGGEYVTDTLLLKGTSSYISWRVEFYRGSTNIESPKLSLLAASYSNTLKKKKIYAAYGDKRPFFMEPTGKKFQLDVPYTTQVVSDKSRVNEICSPTSVVTAIAKFGIRADLDRACDLVYEPYEKIYGNWIRAVSLGSQFGARGYITRFRNISQVNETLRKGYTICASIKFPDNAVPKDELPLMYGNRGTDGHLICLIGIDKDGWIITHDSASRKNGVACRWSQNAMKKVWVDARGGVGYVFTGKR
ncbi:MAG: C39 family peptidase [Candidatus Sumerlaeales bacterium]|nr:C39 family peptidase [Candidatus Sumerlaeales bacterium]